MKWVRATMRPWLIGMAALAVSTTPPAARADFSTPVNITRLTPKSNLPAPAATAIDRQGVAVFFWEFRSSLGGHLRTRTLTAEGVLSPVREVLNSNARSPLGVAVDASERTLFVWDGDTGGPPLLARRLSS